MDLSTFISNMSSIFTFLFSQIVNFANFLTSNLLGWLILAAVFLSLISRIVLKFITTLFRSDKE